MLQSATLFKQANFTEDESAQLARLAELYRNVADGQISSAESSSFMISQMKAFNIEAKDAGVILDRVNEVSNKFAVSSTDIAKGLTSNSASLASFGNTMSETIGLITAGTEIMTGKATQVANGLKSVGSNIVKTANQAGELQIKIQGSSKSIKLLDENTGDLRSTYAVLKDISEDWNKMSKAEQSNLALKLAGKTQISVFSSVMSNFSKAIEANETAMNSSGSAMEENAKRADSLEAKTASLKREFEELVLGQGGLNSLIKTFTDAGIGILKFINTTKALPVVLADIGVLLATILIPKIITFSSTLVSTIGNIIMFTAETGSLSAGLKAVGISASATQLAIGALTAVISIGVLAYNAYKTSQENARVASEQNAKRLSDEANSIQSVINKIKNEDLSREDLKKAILGVNDEYDNELNKIKDVNDLREKGIELLTKEAEERLKASQSALSASYTKAKDTMSSGSGTNFSNGAGKYVGEPTSTLSSVRGASTNAVQMFSFENPEKQLDALQKALDLATKAKLEGKEQQSVVDELSKAYNKVALEVDNNNKVIKEYEDISRQLIDIPPEIIDGVESISYAMLGLDGNVKNVTQSAQEGADVLGEYFEDLSDDEVKDFAKALKISEDAFRDNAVAMGLSLAEYGEYATKSQEVQKLTDDTNKSIDGLQSALGIAQNALKEYNQSGELTVDTFQSLMSISPDWLTALQNENGQLTVNQETLGNLVEQLKIAKIEELQASASADILALAHGNVDEMSSTAQKAVKDLGGNISGAGDDASTATGKMLGFATAVLSAVNASKGLETGELPEDFEAKQKAIIDSYTKLGNQIANISVNTSKNVASGADKGAKGAKKSAKSTTDAYKEEYQKQKDNLDHSLSMNEISEKEYYENLISLNEKYFGEASGQHQKYLDEYRKNQEKIYSWQKEQEKEALKVQKDTYDKALDYIKSNLQKKADAIKKDKDSELSDIDEELEHLQKKRDKELEYLGDRIDSLKEEREEVVDGLSEQIDILDKLQKKEKEEWDSKINAYKEANELLDENIQLQKLQEALAQAKSKRVKIFKDGQFTYSEDDSAVSQAQQSIDEYYGQLKQEKELKALEDARDSALNIYETQINALKDYKDQMSKQYDEQIEMLEERKEQIQEYYDSRIEDMQEYRKQVEEEYDEQIKIMENYIENFEGMINEYDEKQNKLALIQVAGAEAEKNVWSMRLENLKDFVNEYNRLKDEIDSGSTDNKVDYSASNGLAKSSSSSSGPSGSSSYEKHSVKQKATGDASLAEDGLIEVGDDPNKELVIGSKLNGSIMNLSKGDGVVNAKSLNTFAGILNSLPSSMGFGNLKDSGVSGGNVNSMNIDKMYVQADNSMEFIGSMSRDFKIRFKQDAFIPTPI